MPFGLENGPTNFMCLKNSIVSKYFDKFVVMFIDDILIYSEKQEHEEHLQIILHVLREQLLFSKFSKCDFFKDKVQYGISVDPNKINAITEWHVSKNVTNIISFMGIIGYYHKHIEGFSKIEYHVTSLQKKVKKVDWNEKM